MKKGADFPLYFLLFASWCLTALGEFQLCSSAIHAAGFRRAMILADPVSSGALLPPALMDAGILPIYVRSDLDLSERQARTLNPNSFHYELPAETRADLESGNFDRALRALRSLQANYVPKIEFAMGGAESGVMFAEQLAASLQLPRQNDSRGIRSRRYKWHQQAELRKKGVRVMPQILIDSPAKASEWVRRELGGWSAVKKVVVKSGISHAGDQVFVCNNDRELEAAIRAILGNASAFGLVNRKAILQPFIPGREFAVNGACLRKNGQLYVRITDVWEYIKPAPPKYGHEILIPFDDVLPGLIETHYQVIDGLGFNFGPFHGEYRVTPWGDIYLVENAGRLYGAGNPDIAGKSTDYGQIEATVDSLSDEERFIEMAAKPYRLSHQAVVVNINVPDSTHALTAALDPLRVWESRMQQRKHLYKLIYFAKDGQRLNATKDLISTLAQIELRVPMEEALNPQVMDQYLTEIQELQQSGALWRP